LKSWKVRRFEPKSRNRLCLPSELNETFAKAMNWEDPTNENVDPFTL